MARSRVQIIILWALTHVGHWSLYLINCIAGIWLIIYEPWYVAVPLITILANPLMGGQYCVLNNVENMFRQQLGWPLIKDNFIDHVAPTLKSWVQKFRFFRK